MSERGPIGLARRAAGLKLAALGAAPLLGLLFVVGLFAASAPGSSEGSGGCIVSEGEAMGVPADYLPWLEGAAAKYDLGPRGFELIAAIHYIESDFDRSNLPGVHSGANSAGAEGPGQFLPSSWATYGVDANHDGVRNPYSIPDSVFATANMLHADGAPGDWRAAIFDYNHAWWYVAEVEAKAREIGAPGEAVCESAPAQGFGQLPPRSLVRVEAAARWIESRRIHYCWGGGHAIEPGPSHGSYCWSAAGRQVFGAPEAGLDCSGAVRWLLVLSGYPDPGPLVSNALGSHYSSGPGRRMTIWANPDHVFVTIAGRDWGTSESNFAHGAGYARESHAGFLPSHPPGL